MTSFSGLAAVPDARCFDFRALLFGGLKESRNHQAEIELQDTPSSGFHHLLKYIYTGRISLDELKASSTSVAFNAKLGWKFLSFFLLFVGLSMDFTSLMWCGCASPYLEFRFFCVWLNRLLLSCKWVRKVVEL